MKAVEKWLDRITFASILVVVAIDAIRADYHAMLGFLCAAMWVSVAAMRRRERAGHVAQGMQESHWRGSGGQLMDYWNWEHVALMAYLAGNLALLWRCWK